MTEPAVPSNRIDSMIGSTMFFKRLSNTSVYPYPYPWI